jgi:hypothetical protein
MVKDCKPVFLEGFLQPMFFQWILDLVVSNKVDFAVFNAMFGEGVYRWPFSSLSLQLRQAVDVLNKKTTNLVFDVLIHFRGRFVSFCPSFVLAFVFLKIYQIETLF